MRKSYLERCCYIGIGLLINGLLQADNVKLVMLNHTGEKLSFTDIETYQQIDITSRNGNIITLPNNQSNSIEFSVNPSLLPDKSKEDRGLGFILFFTDKFKRNCLSMNMVADKERQNHNFQLCLKHKIKVKADKASILPGYINIDGCYQTINISRPVDGNMMIMLQLKKLYKQYYAKNQELSRWKQKYNTFIIESTGYNQISRTEKPQTKQCLGSNKNRYRSGN